MRRGVLYPTLTQPESTCVPQISQLDVCASAKMSPLSFISRQALRVASGSTAYCRTNEDDNRGQMTTHFYFKKQKNRGHPWRAFDSA
jgi:hypothetical protein